MAEANPEDVESIVFSSGFYRQKTKSIIALSKDLEERFGGVVPDRLEELVTLRGVGRKTASVVLAEAFAAPAIAVDTHVRRVAGRLDLTAHKDPVKIEADLKALYPRKCEVPDEAYTIPFGEASLVREGGDVTVVAIGRMVVFAEKAVDAVAADGIRCDLIDPRTTSPLDEETILESVENTGRLVVVDESNPRCSVAADIAALAASKGFHSLKAPVLQVTAPHSPVPFARELERAYVPSPARIEAAIREIVR